MRFNLFGNKPNILKTERENYVKEFKVEKEITITPCTKFVACLEKLSRNYVLALKEQSHTETLQVANQNDIEFYEGYEFAPNYTDSVRTKLSNSAYQVYNIFSCVIEALNRFERLSSNSKSAINNIKLDLSAISNIVLNIYQHLTMTFDVPNNENCGDIPNSFEELLKYIKQLILSAINELIELSHGLIIEYISKQLDVIINKLLVYFDTIESLN